jgi:hypothetical protein
MPPRRSAAAAEVVQFPDLKPKTRNALMSGEIGTQFDMGQRLFAYYGDGDVFDYGEWDSRAMKTMFSRDGVAAAVEAVLTLPIRGAQFDILPGKGDQGEADFASSVLLTPDEDGGMSTSINDVIGQITSAQIFRRAFFETVWDERESDGRVIYRKVAYRPTATCQARFNDRTGEANGFRQQVWLFGGNLMLDRKQKVPGYVDIPKIRSYIYTHGKYREPLTGVSEMEVTYWCYQTKMKLLYLWYHFLENHAMPRLVVYGNDQTEANTRASDIAALKGSGVVGLVHPDDTTKQAFETISTTQNAGEFFATAMNFLETWQTHSVLAGFMGLTGGATGGKGAYSMSQDQSDFYLKSRIAVANEISDSISHDLIRPLIVLNFGTQAAFPKWQFGPLQDEQAAQLLTLFGQLSAAPALHIPLQVLDLITERMASILQLDTDAVHDALVSTAAQRQEQLAANPPPGVSPETAGSIGALQGLATAGVNIAQARQGQLAAQNGPQSTPGTPQIPQAPAQTPQRPTLGAPAAGPPRPPAAGGQSMNGGLR